MSLTMHFPNFKVNNLQVKLLCKVALPDAVLK